VTSRSLSTNRADTTSLPGIMTPDSIHSLRR
jgi:hypothetical protein